MAEAQEEYEVDQEKLPSSFDTLILVDKLIHGEHNPRRVQPKDSLRKSISRDGLDRPLIVRPDPHRDVYHITDGWQRYQAATDCGWEHLPVDVYETALEALKATETASIVREWSIYEWANYCQSLADQFDAASRSAVIEHVAAQTIHSAPTVRRYLDVMSLPTEVHPLLKNGPEGETEEWAMLRNYNDDVRQFSGLWWTVAAQLARGQSAVTRSRIIAIAALAVEFELADDAMEFVELALENPQVDLDTLRRQVLLGSHHSQYLLVPRVPVRLEPEKKQAILDYCHQNRTSLSEVVSNRIETLAEDVGVSESK